MRKTPFFASVIAGNHESGQPLIRMLRGTSVKFGPLAGNTKFNKQNEDSIIMRKLMCIS